MSSEATKKFFSDMASDADLKAGADAVTGGVPGLAEYAKGKGYDVTTDDLMEVASQNSDLSEEQLEKVAGGFSVNMGISVGCVVCASFS